MSVVRRSEHESTVSRQWLPPQLRLAVNGILFAAPAWVSFRTLVVGASLFVSATILIGIATRRLLRGDVT